MEEEEEGDDDTSVSFCLVCFDCLVLGVLAFVVATCGGEDVAFVAFVAFFLVRLALVAVVVAGLLVAAVPLVVLVVLVVLELALVALVTLVTLVALVCLVALAVALVVTLVVALVFFLAAPFLTALNFGFFACLSPSGVDLDARFGCSLLPVGNLLRKSMALLTSEFPSCKTHNSARFLLIPTSIKRLMTSSWACNLTAFRLRPTVEEEEEEDEDERDVLMASS